jgi:hypothetical protein
MSTPEFPTVHPKFTENVLHEPADHGSLKLLEGTWVSTEKTGFGIHTTIMPTPGTTFTQDPGKFTFLCENYTEEMSFKIIKDVVRNRAGCNEQMVAAIMYEQSVKNEEGVGIHEENGMYLNLGNIYKHPSTEESTTRDRTLPEVQAGLSGPDFIPKYKIARQGTIPHGQSIMLLGQAEEKAGKPEFPTGTDLWDVDHLATSTSMAAMGIHDEGADFINLDKPAPEWVTDGSESAPSGGGARHYNQRLLGHKLYPYSVRPDMRLRDAIKDQKIDGYTYFELSSEYDNDDGNGLQEGIKNIPLVEMNTPVKKMILRMWIENVVLESGEIVQQLQYEQHMGFVFGIFGGNPIVWPHIQVNTLRRKEDVE